MIWGAPRNGDGVGVDLNGEEIRIGPIRAYALFARYPYDAIFSTAIKPVKL